VRISSVVGLVGRISRRLPRLALCFVLGWSGVVGVAMAADAAPPELRPHPGGAVDMVDTAWLAQAGADEPLPADGVDVPAWFARHPAASRISLQGGHYWLLARVRHDAAQTQWVFDPNNTLIERVELRLAGSDGSVQERVSGYHEPHAYSLHYGQDVTLEPGVDYLALVRLDSRYFASVPRLEFGVRSAYLPKVLHENLIVVGSLGAMLALGLFFLLLYALARMRVHLYYALQLGLSVWAWAMVFQIPAELWGWHALWVHYIPFFLLPAAASLFCIDFLDLRRRHPRLHRLHRLVIAASLLLTPVAVFAVPWANLVASILISAWLALMLASGIASLRAGYRPARFFVLAFSALAVPGMIILPGNLGLIPDLVENSEALTLLGSAVEALLQAFALADRIRMLMREKDEVRAQLAHALHVAHTDPMTGLGNRHAFDQVLRERGTGGLQPDDEDCLLVMIDLDGLKLVNDRDGHHRGDELIRAVGRGLRTVEEEGARCYRLGGDEFAILAACALRSRLVEHLQLLDGELRAFGFERTGISFGLVPWGRHDDPVDLMRQADQAMYSHKAERKRAVRGRASEVVSGTPGPGGSS
jgi:diguanylate cyclase (GGDEF)-like protein